MGFFGFGKKETRIVISESETTGDGFSEVKLQKELDTGHAEKARKKLEDDQARIKAELLKQQTQAAAERVKAAEAAEKQARDAMLEEQKRQRLLQSARTEADLALLRKLVAVLNLQEQARRAAKQEEDRLKKARNQIKWKDKGFR